MKKLFLLLLAVVFYSCNTDKVTQDKDLQSILQTTSTFDRGNLSISYKQDKNPNVLDLSINYLNKSDGENYELKFLADKEGNSSLKINNEIITNIYIDPCYYKFVEISDKVELSANSILKSKFTQEKLEVVNDILNESVPEIVGHLVGKSEMKRSLVSYLYFHKSSITTAIRALVDVKDCDCTPHPASVVGKSYFACQEDVFFNLEMLNNTLNEYLSIITDSEEINEVQNLIKYIGRNDNRDIRFDQVYSFYGTKDLYMNSLKSIELDDSSSEFASKSGCPFGKGSAHGCCGNYGGCCYYRNVLCYVHDKMCRNCTPSWFCLSGCVPDLQEDLPYSPPCFK